MNGKLTGIFVMISILIYIIAIYGISVSGDDNYTEGFEDGKEYAHRLALTAGAASLIDPGGLVTKTNMRWNLPGAWRLQFEPDSEYVTVYNGDIFPTMIYVGNGVKLTDDGKNWYITVLD